MELKCRINEKEYPIVQGVTFSEEYNETLDSGTIIISQIQKIEDLKPYDDVFIYDKDFSGYGRYKIECKNAIEVYKQLNSSGFDIRLKLPNSFVQGYFGKDTIIEKNIELTFIRNKNNIAFIKKDVKCHLFGERDSTYFFIEEINFRKEIILDEKSDIWVFKDTNNCFFDDWDDLKIKDFYIEIQRDSKKHHTFYKHLLVDSINREELNFDEGLFKYTILLFSETKRLETIQLPNFSITEPLDVDLKKTAYEYMKDVIDMYSPVYKIVDDENKQTWKYEKKYVIDPSLKEVFDNCYVPDFTLNNPNLRDVLAKIMIIKDMIPYVEDDVIKGLDITKRTGEFDVDYDHINYVYSNLSSNNYCNSLKTTYNNALSQEKSCRLTEFLSFRNKDSSILRIDNMRLETTYPVYRINKIHMCYYKSFLVRKLNSSEEGKKKYFLCKQDITPLVKLNSERNVLSEDWSNFNSKTISTVNDLSKFKFGTIGYDIGSSFISGWGASFTSYKLFNFFPESSTYIEKILEFMDKFYPYGIYNYHYLKSKSNLEKEEYIVMTELLDHTLPLGKQAKSFVSPFLNTFPSGLKGLFFEVEYDAFYNGTIYHSKDNISRDDIVVNDNQSSSLTILESDGISQKEKINRFGNETFQINGRYTDFKQLQPLGSVYNDKSNADNDVVIYSREYSIYDNVINCKYVGAKDYVLKNYFTSVYAKHRPYNLMSYEESVYRSENKKVYLLLEINKKYVETDQDYNIKFKNFVEEDSNIVSVNKHIKKILSFIKGTIINQRNNFGNVDKINYGFFEYNGQKYASDINVFVSGNSLCFNLKMFDNVSAGVYIDVENLEPFDSLEKFVKVEDDLKGSIQNWYLTVDDVKSGFVDKMGFYVCHIDKGSFIKDGVFDNVEELIGKELKEVDAFDFDGDKTTKTEIIDVLKDNSVYKKIFELPKILVENDSISNLIGNEFLIKKDNKELIDMTFQIEAITNSEEKILFSPWLLKLSDLNGIYTKVLSDNYVAGSNNSSESDTGGEEIEITTKYTLREMKRDDVVDSPQPGTQNTLEYGYFPIMILEFDDENVNFDKDNPDIVSIEKILDTQPQINAPISFSFVQKYPEDDLMTNNKYYDIKKINFVYDKIINYDKDKGELLLEGEQQMSWSYYSGIPLLIGSKSDSGSFSVQTIFKKSSSINIYNNITGKNDYTIYPPIGKTWFVYDTFQKNLYIPNRKKKVEIEYNMKTNGNKIIENSYYGEPIEINESNSVINKISIYGSSNYKYGKNLFITTSPEPMKKHQVYDYYRNLEDIGLSSFDVGPNVDDILYFSDDDVLSINLKHFDKEKTKCIKLWYRQETKNNYFSIQDTIEDKGNFYNFVFGVNVDEKDFENITFDENGEEKCTLDIHISLLTHKDMRVFDSLHNVVGEVKNVVNINEDSEEYKDKYLQKYIAKQNDL